MKKILEKEKELPVLYGEYEIVVVGGGIAGVSAALAAARAGKRTLLTERMFALGGLATLGLVTIFLPLCDGAGHQVSFGIAEELLRLSISKGFESGYPDTWLKDGKEHGKQRFEVRYNAQVFAVLLEELLKEAGVELLYGTTICQTLRKGNRVEALVVENKDGRSVIPAEGIVDCSGDADVFHLAGAGTSLHKKGNKLAAWYYETLDGRTKLHMVGASDVPSESSDNGDPDQVEADRISGVDARSVTEWLLRGHALSLEKFLTEGDVSEEHSFATMATIPQLRMTRRIKGRYTLDETEDHKYFEDSIGMTGDWRKRGPIYEIPMRTLYSEELVNVAAAGRCISVTDDMWDITRVIPTCAVTGQAAGLMLALSKDISKVDVKTLQRELQKQGVLLHIEDVIQ